MPIINDECELRRMNLKMSEDFYHETNVELTECADSVDFYDKPIQSMIYKIDNETPCMPSYPNCPENSEVSSSDVKEQTDESEVKSLKDWLLLHNDLIQQQNDDIIEKERQIFFLKRENEMLREQLHCIEKGIPFHPNEDKLEENTSEHSFTEDINDNSFNSDVDSKDELEMSKLQQRDDVVSCSLEVINYRTNRLSDTESQVDTTIDEENFTVTEDNLKTEEYSEFNNSFKAENDNNVDCNSSQCNFVNNELYEFDPFKNIRISIRRKRVSSVSSVLSNGESRLKDSSKRFKRKCYMKGSNILTTKKPYVAPPISEANLLLESDFSEVTNKTTLEVPRWRVKLYTSCYTMEGTENLDDEVYNKRHVRLEIDERRRKRWDVQRIREQRVIEKLKQRHERSVSGSKGEDNQEFISFWPKIEDIKYIQIAEDLPVAAFGYPVPKITPR